MLMYVRECAIRARFDVKEELGRSLKKLRPDIVQMHDKDLAIFTVAPEMLDKQCAQFRFSEKLE